MRRMILLLQLLLYSAAMSPSSADDYTAFVYAGCSQSKYAAGTPYELNVDSVLTSLANAAASSPYTKFTSSAASSSSPANGLLQCSGDLPAASDCDSCVHYAITQLSSFCPSAMAAAVQLRGCLVRYGNDSFLGKPDTSLMYKKCSTNTAEVGVYDSAALGMRDAALGALSSRSAARTGGGYYRAGADGYVQAVAQCVGDQSGKECDECVAAAVEELRADCAVAVSGDVYLGKCYVRCWANGAYGIGSTSGYPGTGTGTGTVIGSNHDHDHDSGKTIAIIIGLMAGVALLVIFFTFIRRSGSPSKH